MVTTRAASKHPKQTKPANIPKANSSKKRRNSKTNNENQEQGQAHAQNLRKRKEPPTQSTLTTNRKRSKLELTKPSSAKDSKGNADEDTVIINRAPVLHLWSACVTHFLHNNHLSWSSCLSVGKAISAICAVSKGRSVGVFEKAEETEERRREREERRRREAALEEVEVMGFRLRLSEEGDKRLAVLSGKTMDDREEGLSGKFGGLYERVREVMERVLESWKGEEEVLNKKAFGMYEEFRPSVQRGHGGWGKKGELRLSRVESVVKRDGGSG
jgi:hypothetical protein